jgi:hypothetical protein
MPEQKYKTNDEREATCGRQLRQVVLTTLSR